jgi:hypothetical protein
MNSGRNGKVGFSSFRMPSLNFMGSGCLFSKIALEMLGDSEVTL